MINPTLTKTELQNMIFVSLITADNPNLSEKEKQNIMNRISERPDDWPYILDAIKDKTFSERISDLMIYLEEDDDGPDPLGIFE